MYSIPYTERNDKRYLEEQRDTLERYTLLGEQTYASQIQVYGIY